MSLLVTLGECETLNEADRLLMRYTFSYISLSLYIYTQELPEANHRALRSAQGKT